MENKEKGIGLMATIDNAEQTIDIGGIKITSCKPFIPDEGVEDIRNYIVTYDPATRLSYIITTNTSNNVYINPVFRKRKLAKRRNRYSRLIKDYSIFYKDVKLMKEK